MNDAEAIAVLEAHLEQYRHRSHPDLPAMLGNRGCGVIVGPSGAEYQIEVDILWDRTPGGDLRVIGSIDDGGWRALSPVTRDFVISPDRHVR